MNRWQWYSGTTIYIFEWANTMVLMLCGCSHKHQSYGDNVISTSRQQWTVSWKQISMTVSVNGWYQDEM